MKNISFILTLFGLLLLVILLHNPSPIPITPKSPLANFTENQRITINGTVTSEFLSKNSKTLIINNQIKIFCPSCPQQSLKGKNLSITAIIDIYNENKSLTTLTIQELKNYTH